jgi:CheY-like chemotaxis protein
VARVAALIPDLLFGSKVAGMLQRAGHDVQLVSSGAEGWELPDGVDVLLIDLVSEGPGGIALLERLRGDGRVAGVRTLAVYSHVDADTRRQAVDAGFDLVVPRSRMVREGAELIGKLGEA